MDAIFIAERSINGLATNERLAARRKDAAPGTAAMSTER
jgi:hypothetical protein